MLSILALQRLLIFSGTAVHKIAYFVSSPPLPLLLNVIISLMILRGTSQREAMRSLLIKGVYSINVCEDYIFIPDAMVKAPATLKSLN